MQHEFRNKLVSKSTMEATVLRNYSTKALSKVFDTMDHSGLMHRVLVPTTQKNRKSFENWFKCWKTTCWWFAIVFQNSDFFSLKLKMGSHKFLYWVLFSLLFLWSTYVPKYYWMQGFVLMKTIRATKIKSDFYLISTWRIKAIVTLSMTWMFGFFYSFRNWGWNWLSSTETCCWWCCLLLGRHANFHVYHDFSHLNLLMFTIEPI